LQVADIAKRIRTEVDKLHILYNEQPIYYQISTGVAEIQPHFQSHNDWLNTADANLYRDKKRFKSQPD
jgi:PleD family two-component response regulator